jgi:hypothetical protein
MPSKLRSTNARVSFFAFLDMITAVTGVLLLITLLLTLFVNDSSTSSTPAPSAVTGDQVERAAAELQTKLARKRELLAQAAALTNRLFVVPEPDPTGKETVLVVLSATNGILSRLGQTTVEFSGDAEFGRLLEKLNPSQQRLVFYVRPSGILQFINCRSWATNHFFSVAHDAANEETLYTLASP